MQVLCGDISLNDCCKRLMSASFRVAFFEECRRTVYFELAGRVIAHSVLQGGPSLDCLCPAVVATVLSCGELENAIEEIMVEDIPLNAGTAELIDFIHEVSMKGYCILVSYKCAPLA